MKIISKISVQFKIRHSLSTIRARAYSVICLSILMFYIIRPVLPFVEYTLNKEYISKNLCINKDKPKNCCQGKCYLHEQLKKNSESPDSNTDTNKKNVQIQKMDDHLKSEDIFIQPIEKQYKVTSDYCHTLNSSFFPKVFTPPRV